jgi:hypothetical protein
MKSKHMDPNETIRDSIESIREVVAHNGQPRIAAQEKNQRNSRGCQNQVVLEPHNSNIS